MPPAGHKDKPLKSSVFMPLVGRSVSEAELDRNWTAGGTLRTYSCHVHDPPLPFFTYEEYLEHRQECRRRASTRVSDRLDRLESLVNGQVAQIRAARGTGGRREVAKRFGVSPSHVYAIWNGTRRAPES